jgi:hypothetical protein
MDGAHDPWADASRQQEQQKGPPNGQQQQQQQQQQQPNPKQTAPDGQEFLVAANAWNAVPSELVVGQPNNNLWGANSDELGAAAAWSSAAQNPNHAQNQAQMQGNLWGQQQHKGMDALSNQLFHAIVKDGCTDEQTAVKVTHMLMNIGQEGVQNVLAQPDLRARMVTRCINDMNGV